MKKLLLTFVAMAIAMVTYAQLPAVTLKTMDGKTISTDTLSNNGGSRRAVSARAGRG